MSVNQRLPPSSMASDQCCCGAIFLHGPRKNNATISAHTCAGSFLEFWQLGKFIHQDCEVLSDRIQSPTSHSAQHYVGQVQPKVELKRKVPSGSKNIFFSLIKSTYEQDVSRFPLSCDVFKLPPKVWDYQDMLRSSPFEATFEDRCSYGLGSTYSVKDSHGYAGYTYPSKSGPQPQNQDRGWSPFNSVDFSAVLYKA